MLESYLLKEEKFNNKLKSVVKTIKEWFLDKIDKSKDLLLEYRDKVLEAIKKLTLKNDKPIKRDIVIKRKKGKQILIAKKGDRISDVLSIIKDNINKYFRIIKKLCNDIINLCKKSLSELGSIEILDFEKIAKQEEEYRKAMEKKEKIARRKELVIDKLQSAAKVGAIISSLAYTGLRIVDGVKNLKGGKDNG